MTLRAISPPGMCVCPNNKRTPEGKLPNEAEKANPDDDAGTRWERSYPALRRLSM